MPNRGHNWKIGYPRANHLPRGYLFSKRIIEKWNKLTWKEVNAPSTATFKERYDEAEKLCQERENNCIYYSG